jgi:hypothetical protein
VGSEVFICGQFYPIPSASPTLGFRHIGYLGLSFCQRLLTILECVQEIFHSMFVLNT